MMNIILLFSFFIQQSSTSDWVLKKDNSGIQVYLRKVEGSTFEEFKGITVESNTNLERVLDVILDVENYESLFPDCSGCKVLKREGKYYDIHYMINEAPWPVNNRDGVFEQTTVISEDGKKARVLLKPLPDYIEEKDGLVRIKAGKGYWELTENNQHEVSIVYQFHGEPGGDIPAWLANSVVISNPYETLTNLKTILKSSSKP